MSIYLVNNLEANRSMYDRFRDFLCCGGNQPEVVVVQRKENEGNTKDIFLITASHSVLSRVFQELQGGQGRQQVSTLHRNAVNIELTQDQLLHYLLNNNQSNYNYDTIKQEIIENKDEESKNNKNIEKLTEDLKASEKALSEKKNSFGIMLSKLSSVNNHNTAVSDRDIQIKMKNNSYQQQILQKKTTKTTTFSRLII
ncbi:hypothetical protein [Candidatus Deianiraea vastatrix]|uniref:Uncharacterized protein n=1 Tax=Candidatus Deianiraea vastatrix TaxID=2163644 RepID=A0A5B8XEI0_9RICK|nr:hypothetical protein [Candidatus Deianiraea vastatrix]QED23295.1 hypothetical protein Deia_00498 [Candidatus Deianiraea vastatrix]